MKIYLINEGISEPIDQPVFSTGDTYVVESGDRIWIWIGEKTSVDEKFAAAFISDIKDREQGGDIDVETVHQGDRPDARQPGGGA